MTYLTKNLAFFSNLDGMQAICAEKMFVEKLPQSRLRDARYPFSLTAFGSSPKGAPLRSYRNAPRHYKSRPLGEGGIAAGDDGRGSANKKLARRAAASAGSRRGSCRLPLRPLP